MNPTVTQPKGEHMTTIKDMSTRELMRALRDLQIYGYDYDNDPATTLVGRRLVKGGESEAVNATKDQIVAELAHRPHVPGKVEGKVLRRLKAQTGMTEEQLRAHPKFGMELADAQHPNRKVLFPGAYVARIAEAIGKKAFGNRFKVIK